MCLSDISDIKHSKKVDSCRNASHLPICTAKYLVTSSMSWPRMVTSLQTAADPQWFIHNVASSSLKSFDPIQSHRDEDSCQVNSLERKVRSSAFPSEMWKQKNKVNPGNGGIWLLLNFGLFLFFTSWAPWKRRRLLVVFMQIMTKKYTKIIGWYF